MYEAESDIFQGEFSDDDYHGVGVYRFGTGERYEGEFRNNCFDGSGSFYWPNGIQFLGESKFDKRHGPGILLQNGRIVKRGFWKLDAFVSNHETHGLVD